MKGQRNRAQMKQQIKIPEKELSKREITNLSDAELKTMVFRMLTEMIEHGHNIKEEVKVILSEIKKNIQVTNSERKKARIQTSDLEQKEEINIHLE